MNRARTAVAATVMVLCAFGGWLYFGRSAGKTTAPAEAPTATVRAVAVTSAVLTRRITAFGEVTSGQVVGESFARPGQVTRLPVIPGRRVSKGGLLAVLTPDPAVLETYRQASTAADLALREWRRQQQLLKLQLATESQVGAAEKSYRDATGTVAALNRTGGGQQESLLFAPFDGIVVNVAIAQGDRIAANAPVLQFGHVDDLRVLLGIEPSDRRLVGVGTPVSFVPLTGVATTPGIVRAAIAEIQDVVDPKSLLVPAVVVLRQSAAAGLVPGMKVRASLDAGSERAVVVPRAAVLTDEQGAFVFQVAQGRAVRTGVHAGLESDGLVAVDGIGDPSLPVVTLGNYELADGMAVKVVAP